MSDARVSRFTHKLASDRLGTAPLGPAAEPLRQVMALRTLDLAALLLRATAILLLLSPVVVGALLVFG